MVQNSQPLIRPLTPGDKSVKVMARLITSKTGNFSIFLDSQRNLLNIGQNTNKKKPVDYISLEPSLLQVRQLQTRVTRRI